MEYDFRSIEKKWQQRWKEQKVYKVADDFSRPKCYVLDMFPYPSGAGLHVGHPLGYIASDIYSRYKKLKGFNVLHPMGFDSFGLPAEQYALDTGQHPAVTTERNIATFKSQLDNIGFCYEGKYQNRIIIPSYNKDNELNYFIGRSYESKPFLKYLNPDAQKEIIIFNEHLIDWDKPIYLVEGAFDSIFLDNAIPMLGKVLSEHLFTVLYEKAKKIIIVLDPDASSNEEKIYHMLNGGRLMGNVYVTMLDGDKDIADLCGNLENYEPYQLD